MIPWVETLYCVICLSTWVDGGRCRRAWLCCEIIRRTGEAHKHWCGRVVSVSSRCWRGKSCCSTMCLVDCASVSFGGSGQNSGQLRVGSVNRWATQDKPEPGMAHTVQIIFIGTSVGGCGCMHTGSPGRVAGWSDGWCGCELIKERRTHRHGHQACSQVTTFVYTSPSVQYRVRCVCVCRAQHSALVRGIAK